MFWIKKLRPEDETGYLYLRETIYVRDKRSHKRTPKIIGNRQKTNERGKYSKKKDTYCGKIIELNPTKFITFKTYIEENLKKDFTEYKINSAFDQMHEDFVDYLLLVHEIDKEEFSKNSPKTVYQIANGYFCPPTIKYLKDFNPKPNASSHSEIERFANRCQDSCIYDEEIIMSLYSKLLPDKYKDIEEEIEQLSGHKLKTQQTSFEEYMRKQHKK